MRKLLLLFIVSLFGCSSEDNEVIIPWNWEGKHILWIGTSIPAGGGDIDSYPAYTAKKLGAIIHNEAVGSSMVRAFRYDGKWNNAFFDPIARSLSQTITEKEKIISYFSSGLDADGNVVEGGTYGWKDLMLYAPEYLTESDQKLIRSCSYERRIVEKYLNINDSNYIVSPDVIVIDHGYNDLNPPIGIYDESEDSAIAIPSINNDRGTFIGSMNYIVDIIRKYNPNQKIVFIGHYESARNERVYKAQLNLFNSYKYPHLELWDKLGWTQEINPETGITITQTNMVDDLHPYSDTRIDPETGFKVAIKLIGDECYLFLKELYK